MIFLKKINDYNNKLALFFQRRIEIDRCQMVSGSEIGSWTISRYRMWLKKSISDISRSKGRLRPHHPHAGAVDLHLELVEVQPVLSFLRVQVVVEVPGREAETVEAQVRGQQQTGGTLLIGHARVAALPAPVFIGRRC